MNKSNFKGFDSDFTCRGFKYEVGGVYTCDENIKVCRNGFHACEEPFAVLAYYPFVNERCELNRFAEVEQSGACDKDGGKTASQKIEIKAELNIAGLAKAQVQYVKSKIKKISDSNTGDYSAATNTGFQSAATNTGSQSAATVTGADSVAFACGFEAKASASKEGFIVICDWRECCDERWIKKIYTAKVGGKIKGVKIEPDTFYWFEDGELKKEKKEG